MKVVYKTRKLVMIDGLSLVFRHDNTLFSIPLDRVPEEWGEKVKTREMNLTITLDTGVEPNVPA